MLVIRFRPQGAKNRQTYRLVVADERSPLDGKYVEMLGWYNPYAEDAKSLQVDVSRLQYWMSVGASISDRAKAIVARHSPEVVQEMNAKAIEKRAKARMKRRKKKAEKTV